MYRPKNNYKHYPNVCVADELPGTLDGIIDLTGNFGVECLGIHVCGHRSRSMIHNFNQDWAGVNHIKIFKVNEFMDMKTVYLLLVSSPFHEQTE